MKIEILIPRADMKLALIMRKNVSHTVYTWKIHQFERSIDE